MAAPVTLLREKFYSEIGQKLFKYSMASVVAVILSNLLLALFLHVMNMGEVLASTLATTISAVPSYEMNRKWAWGKSGKSHLMKEVLPFWGLALLGLAVSDAAVWLAARYANHHHWTHSGKAILVQFVYFGAFGVLWVGKFLIFNSVMFVQHHHEHAHEDDAARTAA